VEDQKKKAYRCKDMLESNTTEDEEKNLGASTVTVGMANKNLRGGVLVWTEVEKHTMTTKTLIIDE